MTYNPCTRAEILLEALPYIKKYTGSVLVIKYGGNSMVDEAAKLLALRDIALLQAIGIKVVLVHGGGPEIDVALGERKIEKKFVDGLRYTCEDTMQVVKSALCDKINKSLVDILVENDAKALGLSGVCHNFIKGKILNFERYGYVGTVESIDITPVTNTLTAGFIPVVAPVATSEKGALNINADIVAAHIAAELGAKKLILMSDVKGILRDVNDLESLITVLTTDEAERLKTDGIITKGMIPKVDCCLQAIEMGVGSCTIIDGRVTHGLLIEMLSDNGTGTMIHKGEFHEL